MTAAKKPAAKKPAANKPAAKKPAAAAARTPVGTVEDLVDYLRARAADAKDDDERLSRTMELARALAALARAEEASALLDPLYREGLRCFALAEASLREPDLAKARALADDALFDLEECPAARRPGVSAAMLWVALRRLEDPRAAPCLEDVRAETARSVHEPKSASAPARARLTSVVARALLGAREPALALEVCRWSSVEADVQRALVAHILEHAPSLRDTLAEQVHRLDSELRHWPLMSLGADALAARGAHREALAWIERFPHYRGGVVRRVVAHAIATGSAEAWELYRAGLLASQADSWDARADWLAIGARHRPDEVRDTVRAELEATRARKLDRLFAMTASLAEAATRCGLPLEPLPTDGAARLGVLLATPVADAAWPALLDEVSGWLIRSRHPRAKKALIIPFALVTDVVTYLARVGRTGEARALVESIPHDDVQLPSELGALAAALAEGGDLGGAIETWSRIDKKRRVGFVVALLDRCVDAVAVPEVVTLIRALDRTSAPYDVHDYYGIAAAGRAIAASVASG